MRTKAKKLSYYLSKYEKFQTSILLVYRENQLSTWSDRCLYGDEQYACIKGYNHRSILLPEIVIEFDTDDAAMNLFYVKQVISLYKQDKIEYSLWHSGNKSYHLHTLIDIKVRDIPNFKRAWMQYYTKGLDAQPDYRLCSEAHLIRAENGVHEKTGKNKELIQETNNYRDFLNEANPEVYEHYISNKKKSISVRINTAMLDLTEHPGVKYILKAEDFRSTNDGRERCLFLLSNVLKNKYSKEDLIKYLQEWYRYSGGYKLDDLAIRRHVEYQLTKDYKISYNYINNLLKELGLDKYCYEKQAKDI
jgi:hypothetical protein